jgi:hypothetical protein
MLPTTPTLLTPAKRGVEKRRGRREEGEEKREKRRSGVLPLLF